MAAAAYSVAELAELTGVSQSAIWTELREHGQIFGVPALRIRSRWLLPRRLIDEKLGITKAAS